MKPALSIVIPVYNAERYLDHCFAVIDRQGLDPNEFEIIAVNDGSSDRSGDMLQARRTTMPNLIVITQENRGAGAARNAGIDAAQGDYLYFFDADDDLADGALRTLLDRCRTDNLDVLFFGAEVVFENDEVAREHPQDPHYFERRQAPGIASGEALFIEQQKTGNFCGQPCLLVARRESVQTSGARFAEGIMNEDNLYVLRATLGATRADTDQALYYRYHVRANTVTTNNAAGTKLSLSHLFLAQEFELVRLQALESGKTELANAIEPLVSWFIHVAIEAHPIDAAEARRMCTGPIPNIALPARLADRIVALEAELAAERERTAQLEARVTKMEASTTWKAGRALTSLPRALKDARHRR